MAETTDKIKIIIADDYELVSSGICSLLQNEENIEVLRVVKNGQELIKTLEKTEPNIVLMDMNMPIMNGYEASAIIKKDYPHIKILILTVFNDLSLVKKFKSLNVNGYLIKNISKRELITAINKVYNGKSHYSNEITEILLKSVKLFEKEEIDESLTKREIEILKLIAEGLSNSSIGKKIFISPRTVDTHRTNLMKKLNINNIAGLVKYAILHGLVE